MPTPTEHVVAMDPGGRSGWASARMGRDYFELTGTGVLRQDLMADWFAQRQAVVYLYKPWRVMTGQGHREIADPRVFDVMVYESWYPREENGGMEWIKGDPLLSAQHIGQLRWIAQTSGAGIVTQHPTEKSLARATMPAQLRSLDKYSNEQHDQDARLHLWLYFWRNWFTSTKNPADAVQ